MPCTSSGRRRGRPATHLGWKDQPAGRNAPTSSFWPIRMDVRRHSLPGRGGRRRETVTIRSQALNSMRRGRGPKKGVSEQGTGVLQTSHAWDDPLEIIAMKMNAVLSTFASVMPHSICSTRTLTSVSIPSSELFIMGDCDFMPEFCVLSRYGRRAEGRVLNVSEITAGTGRSGIRRRLTRRCCPRSGRAVTDEDYRTFWT